MRSYSCFHRGEKCRELSTSLGGDGGGGATAGGNGDGNIWLSKKKRNGFGSLAYATTAKSPEASPRISQKINGGIYKGMLLMLSLKKQDHYN